MGRMARQLEDGSLKGILPQLTSRAAYAKQAIRDKLIEHQQYIYEHGDDMPEITSWRWGRREQPSARSTSTEGDNVEANWRRPSLSHRLRRHGWTGHVRDEITRLGRDETYLAERTFWFSATIFISLSPRSREQPFLTAPWRNSGHTSAKDRASRSERAISSPHGAGRSAAWIRRTFPPWPRWPDR
jgi:hypothetical protein